MKELLSWKYFLATLLYSGLGLVVLSTAFVVMDKCTPYDLWQEIVQKQNRALATVVGFVTLGISIIIAAALLG